MMATLAEQRRLAEQWAQWGLYNLNAVQPIARKRLLFNPRTYQSGRNWLQFLFFSNATCTATSREDAAASAASEQQKLAQRQQQQREQKQRQQQQLEQHQQQQQQQQLVGLRILV
jgi:hypothetical protein